MRGEPYLGHVLRSRIRLHYTWFLAFLLIIVIVATQYPEAYFLWRRLLLGVAASLLFWAAISIRQVALSLVLWRRMPLGNVTLFVFGGVPAIPKEATKPVLELLLGVAGLLSTVIVVVLLYVVFTVLVISGSVIISGLVQWLTFITIMLTLFQLVPVFPLDGGRILRAVLWRASGSYERATRITCGLGQALGVLMIGGGITLIAIGQEWFTGLTLAFVGWVLYIAAGQSSRRVLVREALKDVTARDVMSREYAAVRPGASVGEVVREHVLLSGQSHFVVADDAGWRGCVTLTDIKSVPRDRRDSTRIAEIVRPANKEEAAQAGEAAAALYDRMDGQRISHMVVLEGKRVVGLVTQDSLVRLAKTRDELRA